MHSVVPCANYCSRSKHPSLGILRYEGQHALLCFGAEQSRDLFGRTDGGADLGVLIVGVLDCDVDGTRYVACFKGFCPPRVHDSYARIYHVLC